MSRSGKYQRENEYPQNAFRHRSPTALRRREKHAVEAQRTLGFGEVGSLDLANEPRLLPAMTLGVAVSPSHLLKQLSDFMTVAVPRCFNCPACPVIAPTGCPLRYTILLQNSR